VTTVKHFGSCLIDLKLSFPNCNLAISHRKWWCVDMALVVLVGAQFVRVLSV
jgi:hypothetical protein